MPASHSEREDDGESVVKDNADSKHNSECSGYDNTICDLKVKV